MQLTENQEKAVKLAVESPRLAMISGGAGTGKTTIIKNIVERLGGDYVALCCPTGKAARRLREASGLPAQTIHRAIGWDGSGKANGKNYRTMIIDEASMADSELLALAIAKTQKIILVGDHAQLPPVGQGQPFHDLLAFRPELGVVLTECFRHRGAVAAAAIDIRNGKQPLPDDEADGEVWRITKCVPDAALAKVLMFAKECDWEQDIILACRNGNKLEPAGGTVHGLNRAIIDLISPRDWGDYRQRYRPGDRIINLKNHSKIDTWNGTTGTVTGVADDGNSVWVRGDLPFDIEGKLEQEIEWEGEALATTQHAYALTIHKSQGSQYRRVFLVMSPADGFMATRELVYTGITRAKKECRVIGDVGTFAGAIRTRSARTTVIQELAKTTKGN
jgi:exodeoxyribonuclease V alpha subunit